MDEEKKTSQTAAPAGATATAGEGGDEAAHIVHPSGENPDPRHIYIDEVQGHQRRFRRLIQFTHSSTKAAAFMLVAAIVALVIANSSAYEPFLEFWHTHVIVGFGDAIAEMSLAHVINDILMAIFFLLVGLEIKYEMTVGELTNIRQAALPIIAAFGGVLVPIVIYSAFNAGNPETSHGWGVPTATDIAFALGILSLLGNRVPNGLRVFLSTLAVADDIIAILVIAIFYGQSPSLEWLFAAAVVYGILIAMNRAHVFSLWFYIIGGCVLWLCVYMSGIHSTIAGVLLAFVIPSGSRVNLDSFLSWSGNRMREADEVYDSATPVIAQEDYLKTVAAIGRVSTQVTPPATRLEHRIYPWVYFGILPLFALTNADVSLVGVDISTVVSSPVFLGVMFGLLLGKPIGIMLFSFLTVKLKIATLPENVNWMHMLGAAILGGVGFTMAIFVANLAFPEEVMVTEAKMGILTASFLAGVIGFVFLYIQAKAAERRGVSYLTTHSEDVTRQTAGGEAARAAERTIAALDEDDEQEVRERMEEVRRMRKGVSEVVIEERPDDESRTE